MEQQRCLKSVEKETWLTTNLSACPRFNPRETVGPVTVRALRARRLNAVTDLTLGNSTKLRSEVVADVVVLLATSH